MSQFVSLYCQSGQTVTVATPGQLKGFVLAADAQGGTFTLQLNDVSIMNYFLTAVPSFVTFIPFERALAVGDRISYVSGGFSTVNLLIDEVPSVSAE